MSTRRYRVTNNLDNLENADMQHPDGTFLLCDDCALYAVNDDLTGIDAYLEGEDADRRADKVRASVHAMGDIYAVFSDHDNTVVDDETCDCCGIRTHGTFRPFTKL